MGKGDYNYTIGKMNGRAESTVNFLIKDFCQAIVEILWEKSVAKLFPKQGEDFRQLLSLWNQRDNSSLLFCNLRFTPTNKILTRGTKSNGKVTYFHEFLLSGIFCLS